MRSWILLAGALAVACGGTDAPPTPPAPDFARMPTLAVGERFMCALLGAEPGVVRCIGDVPPAEPPVSGSTSPPRPPLPPRNARWPEVEALHGAIGIAAGGRTLCAVMADGTARCLPTHPFDRPVRSLSVGNGSVAVVSPDGSVWQSIAGEEHLRGTPHLLGSRAVGAFDYGLSLCALGADGRTRCLRERSLTAGEDLLPIDDGIALTGADPLCIVRRDGSLACSPYAQWFESIVDDRTAPRPVHFDYPVAQAVGFEHYVCVRTENERAYCALYTCDETSPHCELGLGEPITTDVSEIAAGYRVGLGRRHDELVAWGEGLEEILAPAAVWPPVRIHEVTDAVAVAVSEHAACAATRAGRTWCWGDGATPLPVEPRAFALGIAPVSLAITHGTVCGLDAAGVVACMPIERETFEADRLVEPAPLPFSPATDLVASEAVRCVVVRGREVHCTGRHDALRADSVALLDDRICAQRGRLVRCAQVFGDLSPFDTPGGETRIGAALSGVVRLEGAGGTLCGQSADGTWLCTGDNSVGQLGRAEPARTLEAWPYPGGAWDSLVVTPRRICALRAGAVPTCTGIAGGGSPRNPGDTSDTTPRELSALAGATALAMSDTNACAITGDGDVVCFTPDRLDEGEVFSMRAR